MRLSLKENKKQTRSRSLNQKRSRDRNGINTGIKLYFPKVAFARRVTCMPIPHFDIISTMVNDFISHWA